MIPQVDWGAFAGFAWAHSCTLVSGRAAGGAQQEQLGCWAALPVSLQWPVCVAVALVHRVWTLGQQHLSHLGTLILGPHTRITESGTLGWGQAVCILSALQVILVLLRLENPCS